MKKLVQNYSFNKTARTVTFTDLTTVRLDRVLLIVDVTNGTTIYQFNDGSLGGTVATNVLTLEFDTTGGAFNNSDSLQIYYDYLDNDNGGSLPVTLSSQIAGEDLTTNTLGVQDKPVNSITNAPLMYTQSGTATKANIKATPGNVYAIRVTNTNPAARTFQLHNTAVAPSAATNPQCYFTIPGGSVAQPSVLELDSKFFAPSEYFLTGISWSISASVTTFTDNATASEHTVHVRYM